MAVHSPAVQAVVRFLQLSRAHRLRLARKAMGTAAELAPLWLQSSAWEEAHQAGAVVLVRRPRGPLPGDHSVKLADACWPNDPWYAFELAPATTPQVL